jgi:LuxR family maltose regulon positive regulatory protein
MRASNTEIHRIEPVGILRAKLHRPRVTRDLVVRPRLWELLNSGIDGQLTLVCAPAGFGKTTLISSWLDSMAAAGEEDPAPPPAAWLSLDAQDSDLVVFLRYMIAALRTLFPDAGSETLALLGAPQQLSGAELFTTINNEIEALPSKFVLVLDDYHLLGGLAVHGFLDGLTRQWPHPLHLVLISRIDPPFSLTSLRAKGRITEIRAADLRFNAEEMAAYLDHMVERPLRQQERDLLEQQTEGWIAALRLATLLLRSTFDVKSLPPIMARSGMSMSDYLQEEILEQQVPAIQTFLLKTAILDRFCVSLGEAVVGQIDPAWSVRACTDWLERADLLTASADERRTWYRYHSLVRDFLKERLLASSGAEVVADLHCKAATWFGQEGLLPEAMRHAVEAGDLDLSAWLIKQGLRDILNREDRATLEHWLTLLPEEFVQRRPWLLMVKAWALQPSWQLGLQSKVVSQAEALLEEGGGATLPTEDLQLLRGQILELQGQYAYLRNQPALCVACCEEALALVPRDWTYVRGGIIVYWGMSMGAIGQAQAAERLLLEEYESLDDKTTGYALRILQALCFNYLNAGQLEPARRTAHVLLRQATRGGLPVLQGWARLFLGVVHYQWNDLDAAGVHLAELLDQRHLIQSLAAHHGMAGLALVYQARGESAEAWRVVEILSEFQVEQRGNEENEAHSLRSGLMLDQGNREGAFRWADAFTAPPPDAPLFWVEVPHITRARILLARNRADDVHLALQILDELLDIAERTHNTRSKITILALRALALDAQGQAEQALVTLQEAVDLSQPGGFLRAFVDLGPPMEGLLGRLVEQSPAAEPIYCIMAAFPGSGLAKVTGDTQTPPGRRDRSAPDVPGSGIPALVEPLTARELEILTLLREPIWPKEIARRLDISYLTVKRHTVNLYGKLGVNTRWDAVNTAVELGLLPPR